MDIAEFSLAELVDDPLVGLVMKSDGVNHAELTLLLERVARARGATGNSSSSSRTRAFCRTLAVRAAQAVSSPTSSAREGTPTGIHPHGLSRTAM